MLPMKPNERLAKTIALGRNRFVLFRGVLGWGLLTALLFFGWSFYSEERISTAEPKRIPESGSTIQAARKETGYFINGEKVTKVRFDSLHQSLEQTSNMYCERTIYGGNQGYEAQDASGSKYSYREEMLKHGLVYLIKKEVEDGSNPNHSLQPTPPR
jgi:hypothetical protein